MLPWSVFPGSLAACGASASCSSSPPASRWPTLRSSRSRCRRSSPSSTRRSSRPPPCSASTRSCWPWRCRSSRGCPRARWRWAARRCSRWRRPAAAWPTRSTRCSCCAARRRSAARRCWSAPSRWSTPAVRAAAPGRRWRSSASPPGPALGGALTQAFDWRAIFLAQVPIALAAASIVAFSPSRVEKSTLDPGPASFNARSSLGPILALALLSAALVGVLFLLVLLLITGWSVTPLAAAAAVTVLPVAAVAAARIGGPARTRAAAGAFLVAGGVLALASLPGASLWWTVLPQAMAGAGLGLALPALAGDLLPENTAEQAAQPAGHPARRHHCRADPAGAGRRRAARRRGVRHPAQGRSPRARRQAPAARQVLARRHVVGRHRSGRPARAARSRARARRGRARGTRRLRRARDARGRDARGRRPGRLRAGVRDLRRARPARPRCS